jgi:hypothetical protein
MKYVTHTLCGHPVTISALNDDMKLYVYCDHCHVVVEWGHLQQEDGKIRLIVEEDQS